MEEKNISVSFPLQFSQKSQYPVATIPDNTHRLLLNRQRVQNLDFSQDDSLVNIKVNDCLFLDSTFDIGDINSI